MSCSLLFILFYSEEGFVLREVFLEGFDQPVGTVGHETLVELDSA